MDLDLVSKSIFVIPEAHRLLLDQYLPQTKLPPAAIHLTLAFAQSLDAQITLSPGVETALSGRETRAVAHYLRSSHDAVLVGVGTAEADDPSLNCRLSEDGQTAVGFQRQPIPIILDPNGRWSCLDSCNLFKLAREGKGKPPMWVVKKKSLMSIGSAKIDRLVASGGVLVCLDDSVVPVCWKSLLTKLHVEHGIGSLMVEGGGTVIEDLLQSRHRQLVQSILVTIAPVWLGKGGVSISPDRAKDAINQEVGRLDGLEWVRMGNDVVLAGRFG